MNFQHHTGVCPGHHNGQWRKERGGAWGRNQFFHKFAKLLFNSDPSSTLVLSADILLNKMSQFNATCQGKLSMYKVLWEILIYAMINVGTCRGCSHYHQMLRMMHHWNDFTRKPEQFQMAPNTFTALQKDPFSPVSHFVEKFNQAGFQIWYDQSNHAQINMTGGSEKLF